MTTQEVVQLILNWSLSTRENIAVEYSPRSESVYIYLIKYEYQHMIRISYHAPKDYANISVSIICSADGVTIEDKYGLQEVASISELIKISGCEILKNEQI